MNNKKEIRSEKTEHSLLSMYKSYLRGLELYPVCQLLSGGTDIVPQLMHPIIMTLPKPITKIFDLI